MPTHRRGDDCPDGAPPRQWSTEDALALIAAVEGVMALIDEHASREAHNETVPLNRISDLRPEPTSEEYRRAITEALGVEL